MIKGCTVILIFEQSNVSTCMLSRKGGDLTSRLLLIVIINSVPYGVASAEYLFKTTIVPLKVIGVVCLVYTPEAHRPEG